MCKSKAKNSKKSAKDSSTQETSENALESSINTTSTNNMSSSPRRGKRVKQASLRIRIPLDNTNMYTTAISRVSSRLSKKHVGDSKSGGIEAILPSLGIVAVLAFALVAKNGWRGRASVAGIDLGTTNSVICVQQQSTTKGGKSIDAMQCNGNAPFSRHPRHLIIQCRTRTYVLICINSR